MKNKVNRAIIWVLFVGLGLLAIVGLYFAFLAVC